MASILNKLKLSFYERNLKRHETKYEFNSNFLPIKKQGYLEKSDKKINHLKLKMDNVILPLDITSKTETESLKAEYELLIKKVEEKYYWKERALKQTKKRANITDTTYLEALNEEKSLALKAVKIKYYPEEASLSKEEYVEHVDAIKYLYNEKIDLVKNKYEAKINNLETKISDSLKRREVIIKELKSKIDPLREKQASVLEEGIILKLDNLSMHFGGLKAVDELSFDVKEGEIFGLIGPNGAGKTTVFNCITRFYKPTSGNMYFKNGLAETVHLNNVVVHNIIKEGIARTFQNVEMVWELNIIENLLVAAHTRYRSGFFGHLFNSRLLRQEEAVMRMKAMKILNDLELTQYALYYPMGLPYGILKKIELARTLMVNPKLIILDEPAAGLNDAETDQLAATIKKIRDDYNTTIFLVEHDMGLVMEICDTVCAISFGKKLAMGTPKEIQSSKTVREAYLGGE